jgi:hypothetical protein
MGSRVQIPRNQFGLIWWILELDPTLDPSLHLAPSNCKLSFLAPFFFGGGGGRLKPIDFPSKIVPYRFSLDLPLFGHGGRGSNIFSTWGGGVSNQLIVPPKWCHVGLASICHFLILDRCSTVVGPIYGSHPIGLLYFIGPSSKLALKLHLVFTSRKKRSRLWEVSFKNHRRVLSLPFYLFLFLGFCWRGVWKSCRDKQGWLAVHLWTS